MRSSGTNKLYIFVLLIAGCLLINCSSNKRKDIRILVFTKTAGYIHPSIPDGVEAIMKLGRENNFLVDTTSDASWFTEDTLKKYSAVIFMSTTGDVLDARQQADFERYIQAGGGYVGIHAASDTEYKWPWYGKLVGAYFKSHPSGIREAKFEVFRDKYFPVLDSLPNPWIRKDELYNFHVAPENVHVLIKVDESSYEGGNMGDNHPMTWYHEYDGGRSFYTALGHTSESYVEKPFLELLLNGIKYAIGKNEILNYNRATSLRKPDDDRFTKVRLAGGLDEPTELAILPNMDILITERKGGVKYYNAKDSSIKEIAHLPVYYKALKVKGVNVEMGLLGIQADPHYDKNNWVYMYFSPADKSVDRLSKFTFKNGNLDLNSEKVILEVKTDREICCHTGGSIAFDADGNLFVSVGDNTTPFDEINPETGKPFPVNLHGYAPIDDRPGFEHYDDRRAAGNSNDLRGKILRIHVNEDATYDIPDGNLFGKTEKDTRPEIYVMGCRNPYRISVDKHSGYLYWGDVGPDARNDSLEAKGPKGYDEVNQARKAGNFGWPYFIGNNYAYHAYNFDTGEPGPAFDPQNVVNNSRNNTGIKNLPSAQPAFIWYPYSDSPDFPIVGSGGRTAMAGPVYYKTDYPAKTRYPDYYDKKLFVYDWIRNWILAVTMDKEGDLQTLEHFMKNQTFNNISDMEMGRDGQLYIVEYGKGWFTKNPDAELSVLAYNSGNRLPLAQFEANNASSANAPSTVDFSAAGSSDPDGDQLRYRWDFDDGETIETNTYTTTHTYNKEGVYAAHVTVIDGKGGETGSKVIPIYVGNKKPDVGMTLAGGNSMFYFPEHAVSYRVSVTDPEDGNSGSEDFDLSRINTEVNYFDGIEKAESAIRNHSVGNSTIAAMKTMEALDCQSCHRVDEKSRGPEFIKISERYRNRKDAVDFLAGRIVNGSVGDWGEVPMPAHSDLKKNEAEKIAKWILSLSSDDKKYAKTRTTEGSFIPAKKFELTKTGVITISASYYDKGGKNVPSLSGDTTMILRNPDLPVVLATASPAFRDDKSNGTDKKTLDRDGGWLKFSALDLTSVRSVVLQYILPLMGKNSWEVELRLDESDGVIIGKYTIGNLQARNEKSASNLLLNAKIEITDKDLEGVHDLFVVAKRNNGDEEMKKSSLTVSGVVLLDK